MSASPPQGPRQTNSSNPRSGMSSFPQPSSRLGADINDNSSFSRNQQYRRGGSRRGNGRRRRDGDESPTASNFIPSYYFQDTPPQPDRQDTSEKRNRERDRGRDRESDGDDSSAEDAGPRRNPPEGSNPGQQSRQTYYRMNSDTSPMYIRLPMGINVEFVSGNGRDYRGSRRQNVFVDGAGFGERSTMDDGPEFGSRFGRPGFRSNSGSAGFAFGSGPTAGFTGLGSNFTGGFGLFGGGGGGGGGGFGFGL